MELEQAGEGTWRDFGDSPGAKRVARTLSRTTVAVSCTNRRGDPSEMATVPLANSLTGVQKLARIMCADDPLLAGIHVTITSGRQGPASYDLQIDAIAPRFSFARLTPLRTERVQLRALEYLSLRLVQATEILLVLSAHPEARVMRVEERLAPQVKILTNDGHVLRTDVRMLALVTNPQLLPIFRDIIAPLQLPSLELVSLSSQLFGQPGFLNITVAINHHVRHFQAGGAFSAVIMEATQKVLSTAK